MSIDHESVSERENDNIIGARRTSQAGPTRLGGKKQLSSSRPQRPHMDECNSCRLAPMFYNTHAQNVLARCIRVQLRRLAVGLAAACPVLSTRADKTLHLTSSQSLSESGKGSDAVTLVYFATSAGLTIRAVAC